MAKVSKMYRELRLVHALYEQGMKFGFPPCACSCLLVSCLVPFHSVEGDGGRPGAKIGS